MAIADDKLHIDELTNKFSNHKKISVDDFNEFYTEVFGNIKRNTVSWYIYELKKIGVIRNISRGQYVINTGKPDENDEYIVMTMDIVNSSKLDYREFDEKLKHKIESLNQAIVQVFNIENCFNISQGDEIQILYPFTEGIGKMMMLALSYLYPFEVRYGISIGEIHDEVSKNSWEMNGPIFWNARDQLEKIKKKSSYEGLIMSGYSHIDRLCNGVLPLINKSIVKITEKQWIAIKNELSLVSVENAMNKIGISKTSYYERLSVSNLTEILSAFDAIYEIMQLRGSKN